MTIISFAKFMKSDNKSGNQKRKTSVRRQKRLGNKNGLNFLKFFKIFKIFYNFFFSLIRTTRNRKLDKFGRRRRRKRIFDRPRFSKYFDNVSANQETFDFHARRNWSQERAANSCHVFSLSTVYDGSAQNGVKLLQLQKDNKHFINLWLIGGDDNLFMSRIALESVVVSQF